MVWFANVDALYAYAKVNLKPKFLQTNTERQIAAESYKNTDM
jgi:hypothetical protein